MVYISPQTVRQHLLHSLSHSRPLSPTAQPQLLIQSGGLKDNDLPLESKNINGGPMTTQYLKGKEDT